MSFDPIQGEPRRRLITVTRRRVVLGAGALLAAVWLAIVGRFDAGNDPVVKGESAKAATPATTTTQTTTESTPKTTTSEKSTTKSTETTQTQTQTQTQTSTSASTSTSSQS